jgi:hypothetical protein
MHMTRSNRVVSTTAAAVLAMVTLSAAPAFADGSSGHSSSGHSVLRASLMGSTPAPVSPTIAGVKPGGAPWVNGPSNVRVRRDGRITVSISGLVIPPPVGKGVNPVLSAVATLVCDNMVRSSTAPFALSAAGTGSTSQMISVPRHCEDPTVLIQPAANREIYIASAMEEDD